MNGKGGPNCLGSLPYPQLVQENVFLIFNSGVRHGLFYVPWFLRHHVNDYLHSRDGWSTNPPPFSNTVEVGMLELLLEIRIVEDIEKWYYQHAVYFDVYWVLFIRYKILVGVFCVFSVSVLLVFAVAVAATLVVEVILRIPGGGLLFFFFFFLYMNLFLFLLDAALVPFFFVLFR